MKSKFSLFVAMEERTRSITRKIETQKPQKQQSELSIALYCYRASQIHSIPFFVPFSFAYYELFDSRKCLKIKCLTHAFGK